MDLRDVSLSDRFDLTKKTVLLSGIQALTRLMLHQAERDRAAGRRTAGYVTGYRGSPVGAVDQTMQRAAKQLEAAGVIFQAGLNEDLAATALWGAQQAHLRGEGTHEGVFGLWYGKGPGVDRTGDVFRHANLAGTAPLGGVLVAAGDDHTCESSTTCHQSDFALLDAMIPVLSPAGVQEVLDFGALGFGLSRYAGVWVGLKCLKDTVEVVQVVDADPHRVVLREPDDWTMPEEGVHIRLGDTPQAQERRMHEVKRHAALAFARANRLDRRSHGAPGAAIGIVAAGKSWLDVVHALELLGLDESALRTLGVTVWKVGMVWPLEQRRLAEWARGLGLIVVVEEKRPLIEAQLKEALFNEPSRPKVIGGYDLEGRILFPEPMALDPVTVALGLGRAFRAAGVMTEAIEARLTALAAADEGRKQDEIAVRKPWFCAGCPHNTSTRVPEGARAYAGIGCHYMVQWMDRATEGFTHMGGEGANWIGESRFSTRRHVFQNLGDGTYNHSGIQAIRAAVAAGTTITYKILYNDAVAMTGGQANDGGLDAYRIVDELRAIGVKRLAVVYDPAEGFDPARLPAGVKAETRDRLDAVQREIATVEGVSAIVYVQTCAAEKRRRRKRGAFPDPGRRVFINPSVCEGCGDCGKTSNCVAILPLETPFGRKREIDQSACNKDFSCLGGFCPSFVTLHGATLRRRAAALAIPDLPEPALPAIRGAWNTVITGIGGTGVVTAGALLSMAAHLEGKGAGEMQMAGLAQKGGAVTIHVRIAETPDAISAIRVSAGEADAVIGGDLVVTAGAKTLATMARGRTRAVVNAHVATTGEFALDGAFSLPAERLRRAIEGRVGPEAVAWLDASRLAERLLGDAIFANVVTLGAAWQRGLVPVGRAAILRAIELNGTGVEGNRQAFEIGRWAAADPAAAAAALGAPEPAVAETLDDAIARRIDFLTAYQGKSWARRYKAAVDAARAAEARIAPDAEEYAEAVAKSLFKLMSYKDEYEVARLHAETLEAAVAERFEGVERIEFHLAPPLLARKDPDGRPRKAVFGPWMLTAMKWLRHGRVLRGTPLDPFGRTAERRAERRAIEAYLGEIARLNGRLRPEIHAVAVAIARLPQDVKGFGHVKAAAAEAAAARRAELWAALDQGGPALARAAE